MKSSTAITILLENATVDIFKTFRPSDLLAKSFTQHPRMLILSCGLLSICYKISKAVFVPYQLWHIPRVSTIDWFWSILKGESVDIRSKRLLLPLMDEHGLCSKYMMGRWAVTVGDPILLQQVLRDPKTFPKQINASLDPDFILTNPEASMSNSDNVQWKRQRKVVSPIFHRAMPVHLFGNIVSSMFSAIDAEHTADIDFADYMRRYALDCLGLGVFDFDMGTVRDPESPYAVIYKHAFSIIKDPLVYLFPAYAAIPSRWIPYRNRARIANEKLRSILCNIIQARKDVILSGTHIVNENKDLLTLMIEASFVKSAHGDKRFLTNGELVANLAVFFVAGHETTASATASTMYYFAKHPDIQERARQEVISALGDAHHDILPTHDQLRQMPFLNNCIKETMRINPPTSGNLPRVASCDTHIGRFFIPKGTVITMELYCAHHLDQYWPDPLEFNPDRFSSFKNNSNNGEHEKHVNSNHLYIPFGYGPRACVGMNFSLAEQRVVQAMMLRKYTWELVPKSEHEDGLKNAKSGGVGLLGPDKLHLRLMKRY